MRGLVQLLDLIDAQLDRGLSTEDGNQGLHAAGVRVDLGDGRSHRCERAGQDGDGLADLVVDGYGLCLLYTSPSPRD